MADYVSISSPTGKHSKPTSFLFSFTSTFASKTLTDTDSVMSPTSILDTKSFSSLKNPFLPDLNPEPKRHFDKLEPRKIGLGDALEPDPRSPESKPETRMVLFGSKLKIQVPSLSSNFTIESPKSSPIEFGMKTKNTQLGFLTPQPKSSSGSSGSDPNSIRVVTGCLSASEMALSEDYTCVIARGPVTKTTHIFDNCVVENCYGDCNGSISKMKRENGSISCENGGLMSFPSESFLSFCHTCKRSLSQGTDIYMYRGEKAFCSDECRCKEMMLEEKRGKFGN